MTASGRILLIANNFPPVRGGSAVVYDNIARFAEGRVIVLAPRRNYVDGAELAGWRQHDAEAPYMIRRLRLLRTAMGTAAPPSRRRRAGFLLADLGIRVRVAAAALWLLLRQRCRVVCLGELLASAWLIDLLRRVPGLLVLVYVHGEEITTSDPYDPLGERRRRALRGADGIVVVSRFARDAVLAIVGESAAGKITLIENGVDTARFVPGPKRPDLLRRYGLEGAFVFVSVCRLLEKKGIDQALRAFASLPASPVPARFLIVGDGAYRGELEALVQALRIGDRVVFAGLVAETALADHYRLGDVFVMPNRALANGDTEGFGLVFLEANSCGLPVIAGRDGGSVDAVRHGVSGMIVSGGSVPDIAAAMRLLRDDPALRATLSTGAIALAQGAGWAERAAIFTSLAGDRAALPPEDAAELPAKA